MKTLEEVKKHCFKNGYSKEAMFKICGWLVAKGLKEAKEVVRYKVGNLTFEDFLEWFENDDYDFEEMERGECVHVCDGVNVMILSPIYNDDFVGIDASASVGHYQITEKSRPCTEKETKMIVDSLHEQGLHFCDECEELEPYNDCFDPAIEVFNELEGMCDDKDAEDIELKQEILNCFKTLIPLLQSKSELNEDYKDTIIQLLEDLAIALCDSDEE